MNIKKGFLWVVFDWFLYIFNIYIIKNEFLMVLMLAFLVYQMQAKNFCGSFGGLICRRCVYCWHLLAVFLSFSCPCCLGFFTFVVVLYVYMFYIIKKYYALEGVYLTCGGCFSLGGDCIRRLFFGDSSKHQQAVGGFIPAFWLFGCFSF